MVTGLLHFLTVKAANQTLAITLAHFWRGSGWRMYENWVWLCFTHYKEVTVVVVEGDVSLLEPSLEAKLGWRGYVFAGAFTGSKTWLKGMYLCWSLHWKQNLFEGDVSPLEPSLEAKHGWSGLSPLEPSPEAKHGWRGCISAGAFTGSKTRLKGVYLRWILHWKQNKVEGGGSLLEPSLEAKHGWRGCKLFSKTIEKQILERRFISKRNMNLQLTNVIASHNPRIILLLLHAPSFLTSFTIVTLPVQRWDQRSDYCKQ